MRLYHCSNERFATLEPQLGGNRKQHEAGSPVYNQPAIFFATVMGPAYEKNSTTPQRYCHVVEVETNDPALVDPYPDESAQFGTVDTWALTRSIDVAEVHEWNAEQQRFVLCLGIDRAQYEHLVRTEYAWLRSQLGMGEVPINFERYTDVDTKGPRYGFAPPRGLIHGFLHEHLRHWLVGGGVRGWLGRRFIPREITLPFSDGDLGVIRNPRPTPHGGPPTWDGESPAGEAFWEEWRTTAWHEVGHQFEDERACGWNPKQGHEHGASWIRALDAMATTLGCEAKKLKWLLRSM